MFHFVLGIFFLFLSRLFDIESIYLFSKHNLTVKFMKQFIQKSAARMRVAFCTAMCALTGSYVASAQGDNFGVEVLNSSKEQLVDLVDSLVSLLQVVLGLGALVTLVMVIFNILKGEREAAQKIAWWVVGLTIGFVLITVVKNLVMSA